MIAASPGISYRRRDKLPRLVGFHDPRQPLLLFNSSTMLLSRDWIGHGLTQLCLHDVRVTHVTLRLPRYIIPPLETSLSRNVRGAGVWCTRVAKSPLNFTASSKRLVVFVESLLLKKWSG